ncbi:MAG: diguanylate cyclase, partial [Pygmaiobacter sp.]
EREKGSRMALYVVQIDAYSELLHRVGWVDARGVLIHAASCITALSGEEALCGRIGEATFAVLRCVANSEQGLHAGTCYCEELLQTTPEGMQSIPVTASVGMVLILEDGIDATELFHAADVALGVAMQQSGTMVCYTPGLEREGVVSGIHFGGAEDAEGGFDNTLLYTFFNRLYGGGDSERSMEQVLRMAGEHYHASRAYIYRLDEEDATISHLMCEWRTEETEPLRSTEKTAKLLFLEESCGEYADGRFYCENMETLSAAAQKRFKKQEVRSVLQFPVVQDGVCFAAIGFHVCNDKRLWNDSERESLALAAKLLGGFLLRVHAKEHASRRDPLTGLQLYGRFRQNAARRLLGEPDSNWQMVCLDVVRFRDINELFGTATGDLLLMRFARQMRMRLADGELACRLTANRYAVLLRRK